jgi:hypothetical protein
MGLTEGNPVIAYWTLSDPNSMFFFRYKGPGFIFEPASWEGPKAIGNGYETKLAGGPSGLFLLSQDYAGGTNPSAVDVRKLEGADFGAPHTLVNDPSPDLFTGGDIAQSPNGRIAVVWPGYRAGDNARVMRLYTSTDGGASFGPEVDVARIGTSYAINDNAQLTVGDDGGGWVTFSDSAGLRMADLSPVAPYVPPPPPKPPVYKGKTKVITSPVDGNLLTLRLPKSCLQQQQPFFAGVGKKARRKVRKSVRAKLKVVKVSFFFDGRKLATKKKKPFRILIEPGPLPPGSTHVVKARVTARVRKHGHKKKVVRILQGTIKIC